MDDLQIATRIGLGAYETPNEVLNAIAPQLENLVTDRVNRAVAASTGITKSSVIKYSAIAAGAGIIGGGLLGWMLAKKFR